MMSKTGRNDKCPCGSGKKYKKCCLNDEEKLPVFDEIKYLKQFTPLSTILWLQAVICHPNNAVYLQRLYFLLGLALSIPERDFAEKEMSYEDIKKLFNYTEVAYSKTFLPLEDFEGFDQVKLIPFFLNQKRYYFFYGNFERPLEQLRQLKEIYFFDNETPDEDLNRFQHEIINSLEFQTRLLEDLRSIEENSYKQEALYVPTANYYKAVSSHFLLNKDHLPLSAHKIGAFNKLTTQDILDKSIGMELFSKNYIAVGDQLIWAAPQIHLNVFINEGKKIFKKKPILEQRSHSDFKLTLNNLCETFFSSEKEIVAILEKNSEVNVLKDIVDFAIIVDSSKLLLFAGMDYSHNYDISRVLNKKIEQLGNLRKKISSAGIVGIVEEGNKSIYGIHAHALEIWIIPVYQPICLDVMAAIKKDIDLTQTFMFCYMDLKAVFDKIEKPFDFLKFLKEDTALSSRISNPMMGEFMDRFYFYITNGKSYMKSGRTFNYGLFAFHMWSNHIFEESWKKYQDNTFEMIELKFPDFFNKIESYKEGVYRMINTAEFSASYLIKWKDRFIWVHLPPNGRKLEHKALHIGAELISPMICDYMKQFENQFRIILSSNGIGAEIDYSFLVSPKAFIDDTSELNFLKNDAEQLSEDNPLIFKTIDVGFGKVRTFIIYDYKLFPKLFGQPQNIGERYAIKALVKSIIEFYKKWLPGAEKISENFINDNLPLGIKAYSVEAYNVPNANIDQYTPPISLNETDVASTTRIISEFLIKTNIKPGNYKGDLAKDINYKIYTFLQDILESKISLFDKQFIVYAYKQLELAEGDRYLRKLDLGTRSKGRTDYDILESTKENENESSRLNVCIKHIIHTALKTGNSGKGFVTGEVWTRLTALADAIMTAANIYDYIQYDLHDHTLKVTDDFLIEDISGEEVIDSERLQIKHIEIKIENAKRTHTKAIQEPTKVAEIESPKKEVFVKLDTAFKSDLGFTFDDFVFVLHALSVLPFEDKMYFPAYIKSTHELFVEINKIDTKGISEETVDLVLNFLCLYRGIYKPNDLLYSSDMMRNKERINVSPFIKLEDKLFLFGNEAVKNSLRFWSGLTSGDFPFVNKSYPNIKTVIDNIHRNEDLALEKLVEEIALKILGQENVEVRVANFKRLSDNFKRDEDCGEIDLLCINRSTKTIFVIDAKNVNKKMSVYYIKQSVKEFFEGKKSYYSKLLKKKQFVQENIAEILGHFKVTDRTNWKVIEAFVSEEVYFAAYYNKIKVDFILVEDLETYLQKSQ